MTATGDLTRDEADQFRRLYLRAKKCMTSAEQAAFRAIWIDYQEFTHFNPATGRSTKRRQKVGMLNEPLRATPKQTETIRACIERMGAPTWDGG